MNRPLAIVTIITCVSLGIAAGVGFVLFTRTSPAALVVAQSAEVDDKIYRQLNLLGDIFERVREDYVEKPEEEELIKSAINGMLNSLDPHSSYLDAEAYKDMRENTSGEFGGLGIEVTLTDGVVQVVSPIDDTPAQRAGMQAGDRITHLDGESITGITLYEAVKKMRGEVGEEIVLTVAREGITKPFKIKIVRDLIRIQPVKHEARGNVGYVRITVFNNNTTEDLHKALEELSEELETDKVAGYILDLRNNPGGLLNQAVSVSDSFLDRGEIVSTRGRQAGNIQRFNAKKGDMTDGAPIIVLINGGAASASEIVAGALQDHRRATILGTRSFGKGSVQTVSPIGEGGALRLTTGRYYVPSGESIHDRGIEPDIEVKAVLKEDEDAEVEARAEGEEDEDETSAVYYYVPRDKEEDAQINYAMKLLQAVQEERLKVTEASNNNNVN
ncbi:MAG: S41 family peptidase [Parvularculales bacterium]